MYLAPKEDLDIDQSTTSLRTGLLSQEREQEGMLMATVTAIYRPFLVAVRKIAIGTHWGCGDTDV